MASGVEKRPFCRMARLQIAPASKIAPTVNEAGAHGRAANASFLAPAWTEPPGSQSTARPHRWLLGNDNTIRRCVASIGPPAMRADSDWHGNL